MLPTPTPTPELKVDVSGAVASPGVYTMVEGDRLEDALAAAGGPLQHAGLSCVNLAARVVDQAKYCIPTAGEPCPVPPAGASGEVEGKIDLNSATSEELEELPGIGPAKARAIIDYRELNGPFKSIEAVLEVKGIGPAILEGIRDRVRVGPERAGSP